VKNPIRAMALALVLLSGSALAAPLPAPLGVTYSGWRGGFTDHAVRLATFKKLGFPLVSFVPSYSYVGLNEIDLASGPSAEELGAAVEAALREGFQVVVKPHLNPPAFQPGFDSFTSDNHSWRAQCPWRGFFDVDPMTRDYREGIILSSLRMLKTVLDRLPAAPPVRLELGVELMNSTVEFPDRWERLLAAARQERTRLGLGKRVLLSHNFEHHLEIPEDFLDRMDTVRKRALARYIAGLDAVALSQYMDLTVAVPAAERGRRLPTADEVAQALVRHESDFRHKILQGMLGIDPRKIPPLHIGEFGIGRGGLKHPNLWSGEATPAQEQDLARQIARGHEGLVRYLALREGRTAGSAVLWVTGWHYDIFGWMSPKYAIPGAAAAIEAGLAPYRGVARPTPP
jgi:hypothetical protein